MNDHVDNKIKDYRIRFEMTQADLAKKAGVSRQSIISIEKGQYIPSLPLALKLSEIFDCSVKELFELK